MFWQTAVVDDAMRSSCSPPSPPPPTASALLSFGGKNCCFRSGDPMRSRLRMAAACSEQVEHLEIYRIPTWFSPQIEGGGGGVVWHCITSLIFSSHNPQTPPTQLNLSNVTPRSTIAHLIYMLCIKFNHTSANEARCWLEGIFIMTSVMQHNPTWTHSPCPFSLYRAPLCL